MLSDERTVQRLRPDVEEFLFHEEQRRARWAHRLLRDHAVLVGDHAPELRHPYMSFGRDQWLDDNRFILFNDR